MTRQRRVILEILGREGDHPTADEVYRLAHRQLPRISLGTVYRNLHLLAGQGLILEVQTGGRQRRFDGKARQHDHVRCLDCGRVEDVIAWPAGSVKPAALGLKEWEIVGRHLELTGFCPRCKAAS